MTDPESFGVPTEFNLQTNSPTLCRGEGWREAQVFTDFG